MHEKLTNVDQELQADSAIGIGCDDEDINELNEQEGNDGRAEKRCMGQDETLKQPCITRWNSVLTMTDSILLSLERNGRGS